MSIELLTGDAALAEAGALKPQRPATAAHLARVAEAADLFNISVLAHPVKKYFLCYPKSLRA